MTKISLLFMIGLVLILRGSAEQSSHSESVNEKFHQKVTEFNHTHVVHTRTQERRATGPKTIIRVPLLCQHGTVNIRGRCRILI